MTLQNPTGSRVLRRRRRCRAMGCLPVLTCTTEEITPPAIAPRTQSILSALQHDAYVVSQYAAAHTGIIGGKRCAFAIGPHEPTVDQSGLA